MRALFDLFMSAARRGGLIVGPCFLAIALGYAVYTYSFLRSSVASFGRVVSLTTHSGEDDSVNYFPVFTFVATNGQEYTVSSDAGSNPSEFTVGQSVPIRYRVSNPVNAKISSYWQLWTIPTAFGVLGIIFGGIGYGLFQYERHRDRRGLSIAT